MLKNGAASFIDRFFYFTSNLINIFFPAFCVNCHKSSTYPYMPLCQNCRSQIKFIKDHRVFNEINSKSIVSFFALGYYEGVLRNLIISFKYHKKTFLSAFFVSELLKHLVDMTIFDLSGRFDIIIPIPLHPKKLKERGFNQSDLLAIELSRITGIEVCCDAALRIKETLPQNKLKLEERFKNLEDAFEINSKKIYQINGKNVIIIDDILTTGATAENMARSLKRHGARNIIFLSIAKTSINRVKV